MAGLGESKKKKVSPIATLAGRGELNEKPSVKKKALKSVNKHALVEPEMAERMRAFAYHSRLTEGEIMRQAIHHWLEKHGY